MPSTSNYNKLYKGLQIVLHASIREKWTSSARLSINSGIVYEQLQVGQLCKNHETYFLPRPDWRGLTAEESSLLISNSTFPEHNLRESIVIFPFPESLSEKFWELDIAKLFTMLNASNPEDDSQYRMFLADAMNYLIDDLGFTLSGNCACAVEVNKIGLRSTRYDAQYQMYTGLDVEHVSQMSVSEHCMVQAVACINLGDEASHLFFINLTIAQIIGMLKSQRSHACSIHNDKTSLAKQFFSIFPQYPVSRLTIMPGEGIVMPAGELIHDGSTLDKAEPDVLLKIRAYFSLEGN